MASDAVILDQQQPDDPGSLAELFVSADSAIERRRTENIFKQLDERSLTEDEEKIIQQRVELQRKLLEEYEKREQKRKVAELQDMWPDLSEAAAVRALELCSGREEEAVLRLTEDAAFKRRVMAETGTHTPTMIVLAPKQARNRGASSGSSRSTTTRIISPSQMNGRVFVGRFRSKLGPYQVDPALQAALAPPAAVAGSGHSPAAAAVPAQQPKKRGRPRKLQPAAPAASAPEQQAEGANAVTAAAALSAGFAGGPAAAAAGDADIAAPSSKRQRSSSPSSDAAAADGEESDAATETEPETDTVPGAGNAAGAGTGHGVCTDSGADTDTGAQQGRQHDQQQGQVVLHADRVVTMMARQVARLEPLVAAGRLLEFEARRPGSSPSVLEVLAAEYGEKVSVPIATAWEVLLEEQKLNATLGLQSAITTNAAAAAATSSRAAQSAVSADEQPNAAAGSVSSPRRRSSRRHQPLVVQVDEQGQQQQQHAQQQQQQSSQLAQQPQQALEQQGPVAGTSVHHAAAAAAGASAGAGVPAHSDASTVSEEAGGVNAGIGAGTPTSALVAALDAAAAVTAAAAAEAAATAAAAGQDSGAGSSGRGRGRRAAAAGAAAVSAAAAAAAGGSRGKGGKGNGGGGSRAASRAISETGHTCRGRVRQKSHKTTELVEVGELVVAKDWFNAGYIFPAGFKSRLLFRSSVDTDALCLHECEIIGQGGTYWPSPTFKVTARDREDEPVEAKSCTGCWSQILKRINATISQRIAAGENLPPPPRTAIAGPEYFGLNDLSTIAAIEALDPEHLCTTYWVGKEQREAASAGLPITVQPLARGNSSGSSRGGSGGGRKRGRQRLSDVADADDEGEEGYKGNHWSAISRRERYLKRCTEAGDEVPVDADQNLLPGVLDPVTLEPVVNPAISPAGHVMGLATWKAVLSETGRCPFTKAPLRPDMLTVLTVNNIEKHRARIVAMS